MSTYDSTIEFALEQAVAAVGPERFAEIARACEAGDRAAARRVTAVADVFVAWLRRVTRVKMTLVAIEEIDTGAAAPFTPGGSVTDIDTSQRARYTLDATDDRQFPVDATLAARSTNPAVATVEIFEATGEGGTASGKDELLATFAGTTGTTTIEVFDPANPDVVLAADVIVANPGGVASVSLGTPTIEEIPTEPTPV